jgi:hypothetical protein
MATRYSPFAAAMSAKMNAPIAPTPGAKAVHVVHEIEGVDDGEQPENRDGVAKSFVRHEQRDAFACKGDEERDEKLPDEFRQRFQFMFVVEPAENRDGDCAERDDGEFNTAAFKPWAIKLAKEIFTNPA